MLGIYVGCCFHVESVVEAPCEFFFVKCWEEDGVQLGLTVPVVPVSGGCGVSCCVVGGVGGPYLSGVFHHCGVSDFVCRQRALGYFAEGFCFCCLVCHVIVLDTCPCVI